VRTDPPYLIVSGAFLVGSNVMDAHYVSIDKRLVRKAKTRRRNSADPARARSGGRFVVSRAGEEYDVQSLRSNSEISDDMTEPVLQGGCICGSKDQFLLPSLYL
jgi:hypothetical protein